MNFDKYTNFKIRTTAPASSSSTSRKSNINKPKTCMSCGNPCENHGSHLYYQHFCSDRCKQEYISHGSSFFKSSME